MTIQIVKNYRPYMFDSSDWCTVCKYKWTVNDQGYVVTDKVLADGSRKVITMHRLLLGLTDPKEIADHKNHIRSDNRRANIRKCSTRENAQNRVVKGNKKYLGVHAQWRNYRSAKTGEMIRYQYIKASITVDGKPIYLGMFDTEQEAALAYNEAARKYFGSFANLNKL